MIVAASLIAAMLAQAEPSKSCDARWVLAQVRRATGGYRWDEVAEIVGVGVIEDAGSSGSFHIARDLKTGRSSFSESLDAGRVAYIYDGATKWEVDQGGGVHALDAPDSIARAITNAFVDSSALWSDSAASTCSGVQSQDGSTFDVLRVQPPGGNSADLWVDRATHLIERKVEQWPATTMTEQYEDYRRIGGVMVPFRMVSRYDDQNGASAQTVETVRSYRVLRTVRAADFARPSDTPAGTLSGPSTSVPIMVDHGVIVFNSVVDGKGPFAFTFDPGAQGVLTATAATPLGLAAGKMARVSSIRVGSARIDDLDIAVYAGAPTDLFAQRSPGAAPIAGSLGPELLDRFDVRLDYAKKTMTLEPFGSASCNGDVERFVLQEDDDIPLIHASVDGHDGLFQFDVRAPTSLLLFKPFLDRIGLPQSGVVHSLSIGGTMLHDVPARYLNSTTGKFASRTEAGLLGSELLSRFVTTIDYRGQSICFEAVHH